MPAPSMSTPVVAATFLAQNRGGGLFSEMVSQRLGAYLALAAYRVGLSPSALTLTGLTIGVGTSVTLITSGSGVGLAALVGWQLAYALDCADGQLARVTGRASERGARLDILCDVAVQISVVAALVAVAAARSPGAPAWLYAVFAGTWLVNVVTSVLAGGPGSASLLRTTSARVRVVKLVRDYGAVVAVCALVVTLAPGVTIWLLVLLSVANGLFLLASIAQAALTTGG